ncbi:hypothetical protein NITHO_6120002 [Nitrolancea hollandica Lb]|uniref:Uncharacterized protein n=1 Tax=Nitrolancea hollandica Lb TaxID=1129897 RepID=I4EMJ6_9BACT|nr:hypothetical protein NITHO_6120002 [Nitrolancea hollandica Lb]
MRVPLPGQDTMPGEMLLHAGGGLALSFAIPISPNCRLPALVEKVADNPRFCMDCKHESLRVIVMRSILCCHSPLCDL